MLVGYWIISTYIERIASSKHQNMADEDNTNNTDTAAGQISPGHGAHDGERSRSPTRSPTRSPEASPGRPEKSDDSERDNRKRKRSPSPKDEKVDSVGEKFDLFVPTRKKERHMWALPVQLADYFNDLTREFFEDDDLRDGDGNPIKEVHPSQKTSRKYLGWTISSSRYDRKTPRSSSLKTTMMWRVYRSEFEMLWDRCPRSG